MKYMVKLLKFIVQQDTPQAGHNTWNEVGHAANILKYVTSINFCNFTMYFITLPDDGQYWPKHVGVNIL